MLLIGYGGQYATRHVRALARHAHRLQQAFGMLVILVAVGLYFQYDTVVTVWLSQFSAAKVLIVAGSPSPVTLGVSVDGRAQSAVTVGESRM